MDTILLIRQNFLTAPDKNSQSKKIPDYNQSYNTFLQLHLTQVQSALFFSSQTFILLVFQQEFRYSTLSIFQKLIIIILPSISIPMCFRQIFIFSILLIIVTSDGLQVGQYEVRNSQKTIPDTARAIDNALNYLIYNQKILSYYERTPQNDTSLKVTFNVTQEYPSMTISSGVISSNSLIILVGLKANQSENLDKIVYASRGRIFNDFSSFQELSLGTSSQLKLDGFIRLSNSTNILGYTHMLGNEHFLTWGKLSKNKGECQFIEYRTVEAKNDFKFWISADDAYIGYKSKGQQLNKPILYIQSIIVPTQLTHTSSAYILSTEQPFTFSFNVISQYFSPNYKIASIGNNSQGIQQLQIFTFNPLTDTYKLIQRKQIDFNVDRLLMNRDGKLLMILGTDSMQLAYIDQNEDETTKYSYEILRKDIGNLLEASTEDEIEVIFISNEAPLDQDPTSSEQATDSPPQTTNSTNANSPNNTAPTNEQTTTTESLPEYALGLIIGIPALIIIIILTYCLYRNVKHSKYRNDDLRETPQTSKQDHQKPQFNLRERYFSSQQKITSDVISPEKSNIKNSTIDPPQIKSDNGSAKNLNSHDAHPYFQDQQSKTYESYRNPYQQ